MGKQRENNICTKGFEMTEKGARTNICTPGTCHTGKWCQMEPICTPLLNCI